MGELNNSVDLSLEDISPIHGTTKPRLEVEVSADPSSRSVVIVHQISTSLTLNFDDNRHIDGPIPSVKGTEATKFDRSGTSFRLLVDFSYQELDIIESYRDGGDIELEFDLSIAGEINDNRQEGRFNLSEELIDGQWARILDAFDYHDKRGVEIDLGIEDARIRDRLATAQGKIERAQQKHDTGDYPAAVTECRRAIEALRSIEETSDVLDQRKNDDLDGLMQKFEKRFTGGLSHAEEKTDITPALRRDSEFALNFTKACARYISVALEEGGG